MRVFKFLLPVVSLIAAVSCDSPSQKSVDTLIYNARIYTVDSAFSIKDAMAIKEGEILKLGTTEELTSAYTADQSKDAGGKAIVPGLFDAHAHFLEYGLRTQEVNLRGTQNYDEVLDRTVEFQERQQRDWITGMGWDQNDWPGKKFPTKKKLDSLFPDTPVALTRIDGHAMIVNQRALDKAGIDASTKVEGGSIKKANGELTGLLIDNAREKIRNAIPETSPQDKTEALLTAQKKCLSYGLTTVSDCGLTHRDIQLMDSLALEDKLKISLYPMLVYDSPHLDEYLHDGLGENKGVSCRAIKLFGDGALGSRGAALKEPYADDPGNYGKMRASPESVKKLAGKVANSNFQLNTHAIGDSTNAVVLKAYNKALKGTQNRRWRIEHAQIIDSADLHYFNKNSIPSVQPTHAISDMDWAGDRLGKKRLKNAYAYKRLLNQAGLVALGTDFPIEKINPFRTFYTAVARKDRHGNPADGFQADQSLTRQQALKGMTIWAAYSQFSEDKKGSLESGKRADFVILDRDLMKAPIDSTRNTKAEATYVKGERVFP